MQWSAKPRSPERYWNVRPILNKKMNKLNKINENIYSGIIPSETDTVQGWNNNLPIFRELVSEAKPNIIVEVGTWRGASAIDMAKIVKELNLKTKIYCVDTWLGGLECWTIGEQQTEYDLKLKNGYPGIYFDFLSNVVRHDVQDIIVPIPNTSSIGMRILQEYNIKADLIYIDASHEYEDVKRDLVDYLQILKEGGIMFGDDINWVGVKKAVDEIFKDKYEEISPHWIYRN